MDIKCHTKPTENFQYLHRESAHPDSCFKSFIQGEVTRYIRNNNCHINYETKLTKFQNHLANRGYKKVEIRKCLRQMNFNDRKVKLDRRNKKEIKKQENGKILFCSTYNPNCNQLIKSCL